MPVFKWPRCRDGGDINKPRHMNLDKFKGKTLDGETLAALTEAISAHVSTFEERAVAAEDKARKAAKESIEGRKGKDEVIRKALEKLGIESAEELDNLPDAKGQADAMRQAETRLKRLERDLADKTKAFDELQGKYTGERRERAIAEAVAKHPFIDPDDARALIGGRVVQEGDDLLFNGPDGKAVPLADGVAWFAKTKTHLVRAQGNDGGGSGFKGSRQDGGGARQITRAEFDAMSPGDRSAALKGGAQLTD